MLWGKHKRIGTNTEADYDSIPRHAGPVTGNGFNAPPRAVSLIMRLPNGRAWTPAKLGSVSRLRTPQWLTRQ